MKNYIKHYIKYLLREEYRLSVRKETELERIKNLPRFKPFYTNILDKSLKVIDGSSFIFIFKEVFNNEIYKFKTSSPQPYILDCGANIGLSTIYFKKLYPDAEIISFEPDGVVFDALSYNIKSFNLSNVKLIQKALWNKETQLSFFSEGADGGNLFWGQQNTTVMVQTESLRNYLNKPVDLLKIDIEGAETIVLQDCKDLLNNVKNIFVEYHSFINEPQTLNCILELLTQAGFRLHIHSGGLVSTQPFFERRIDYNMDLQLNIFAFKE